MSNREKVISNLQVVYEYLRHFENTAKMGEWVSDGLALLKEQEAIKPTINEYGEAYCICGENVGIIPNNKNLPSVRIKYCSECGRRMKWK